MSSLQPQSNSIKPLHRKTIPLTIGFISLSILSSLTGIATPALYLNENQVLYLTSTSSQVLAATYGLTLTGLVFFINELNREQNEDETIIDSTNVLKTRYYHFMLFITALSATSVFIGNFAISALQTTNQVVKTIALNTAQIAFIFSMIAIALFIFEIIDPRAIEKASDKIKQDNDPQDSTNDTGSLQEFLKNFNAIEYLLQKYGQAIFNDSSYYENQSHSEPSSRYINRHRFNNPKLADILLKSEKIDQPLYEEVLKLVKIRNSIVHGTNPAVSNSTVKASAIIMEKLKRKLTINNEL